MVHYTIFHLFFCLTLFVCHLIQSEAVVEAGLGAIASMVQASVSVSGETNGHGHNGDLESEDEGEDTGECNLQLSIKCFVLVKMV